MIKTHRLYDRRVVDRYREKGLVKETDYEAYIKNLPDESNNAQWVQIDLYEAEMGDGEEHTGGNHIDAVRDEDSEEEA